MEKNLEKSLKRFLKRKVKITTAFIVAFLLGSLSSYGATLDEIFANGDLVKNSTKVGYETKKFKISYDRSSNSIRLGFIYGTQMWDVGRNIKIDSLNEVQKNSLLKSLEAFANSTQEELKPTTKENGINNGIILNIGETENPKNTSAQEIASGIIINKGDIYSGGTRYATYSQNITGENGVAVNDGNIYGIGGVGQKAYMGTIINNGNIFSNGQLIDNSVGMNNGNIFLNEDGQGQEVKSNGVGVNAGNINCEDSNSNYIIQKIDTGTGINVSDIFLTSNSVTGQEITSGIGVNNKNIKLFSNTVSYGQIVKGNFINQNYEIGMGFNNGMISAEIPNSTQYETAYGQKIDTRGVGINNGVLYSSAQKDEEYGQCIESEGTGINNGIIIANKAYHREYSWATFYKNGIALKKDDTGKLVINTGSDSKGEEYNNNIDILGNELKTNNNFSSLNLNEKVTGKEFINGQEQDVKGHNLFINNLGVNEQGAEDTNNKDNQLVIDKDLTGNFANTHITTAVTNGNFDNNNGAVVKVSKNDNNFSMDKSTIAGYFEQNGTLADMTGANDITLSNSVISASGKDNTIDTTAVKFGAGSSVALNNSTISGKIDFSAGGDNTLNLNGKYNGDNNNSYKDGTQHSTYAGDILFGAGADNIDIKFTETKDGNEVADYNSSYDKKGLVTLGNVNFGDGNDTLSFSFDEMRKGNFVLAGNIDFGTGNDTVALKSKIDMNDKGETITLLNNFLFNKIKNGTLETLQLADSGNTIRFEQNIGQDKLSLNFNGKILGGKGDDKFIVSADKLKNNLDSLNGGADDNKTPYNDNDILELTTAVDNTSDFILFKNVENVETLKLADIEGNKLDINNISTSNPDTLRFKNYVGGDKDDNFTVSIENFEKVSLIDGGGNGTAGDTLKIDEDFKVITNIKNDGTIDDTVFGKIQNIENLEFGSFTDAQLNLNNLTSEYLKNLNIKLGGFTNEIHTSTNKLKDLKGLTGKGNTVLTITNAVTDRDNTFDFLAKGDGTNGVNSIKKIHFSENDDTINLDNLNTANSEIIKIFGEGGNDTFITSLETLGKIEQLDGGKGGERNSLEITDTLILNNETNSNVFENVYDIEKLVLSGTGNNIVIDNLVSSDPTKTFIEVTGTNGGEKGNTFIINGDTQDSNRNTAILEMAINGGSSVNDTLKVNTGISTEQLSNKTGIENLVLGNADNAIDFTYKDQDKNLEDFKNITSGNGNDTFTVSADNIGSMTINGGGNTADGKDTLKLSGDLTNENALNGVLNIENLELDINSAENIVNLENAGFTSVTGGNGNDTFNNVSVGKVAGITGGAGNDTISLNEAVTDNSQINFGNLFAGDKQGIEKLNLSNNGGNKLSVSSTFSINTNGLNILNIGKVNFGTGKNNTLTFIKNTNPTEYNLSNKTDVFNGNVAVDLNSNIISTGSSLSGDTIKLTDSFIGNGKVTFSNGEIRFNLADNISFADGTATKYNIDFGKLAESKDLVKTYSFLNIDTANGKLTVKSLDNLVNEAGVTLDNISNYAENYEILLKKYNTDTAVKTAFNNWTAKEIVDGTKDFTIKDLGAYTFDNNSREYQGITSSGTLEIDTSAGNKINDMIFNAVAGDRLTITNNLADGNGKIIFNGTTSFANGICGKHSPNAVHLDFNNTENNGVTVGDILLGEGENSITIADVSKFDIKKENSDGTTSLGSISAEGTVKVVLEKLDENSTKFNNILANAEKGKNNSVEVTESNNTDIKLTTNYTKGELAFTGTGNTVNLGTTYDGNIKLGDNTFNINKSTMSGDIDGGTININETSTMNGKITDGKVNVNKGTWNVKENTKVAQATLNGGTINLGATNLDTTVNVNSSSNIQGTGTITSVNLNGGKLSLGDTAKVTNLDFKENGSLGIGENFSGANVTNVTGTAKVDIDYNVKDTSNFADQMEKFAGGTAALTQNGNSVNLTGVKLSEIISGNGKDTFIMNNASDLNIKVTDNGTDDKDTLKLGFSVNNNSFDNISGIENLELKGQGNILDLTNLSFKKIESGEGNDTFTISQDKLGNISITDSSADDSDTLKLSFKADGKENDISNVSSGIENLQLADGGNNINIDSLKEFTTITGGAGTDTFVSTSSGLNGKILTGGAGQDTLEIKGSFNNTADNPFTKADEIENLKLADAENKIAIDKLGGFTNITGGAGTDTFLSTSNGLNGKTLTGGAGQDTLEMKDSFDNTADNPFTKADGIETLKLADVTGNIVDIDKLTDFTTINGGNQGDSFTIGDSSKLGITINGGTGNDSLVLNTSVDTSKDLKNISSIENLTFNAEGNKLSFADTDKNNFTSLSFGDTSTGNAVALNNLNGKEIIFGNSKGNTVTIADSSNKFNHKITGAEKIELAEGNSKWTFADGSLITGNTELNLNGNNLDFTNSQGKGNVGLDGTNLKINDVSFVGTNSRVTLSNGTIKIGFDNTVKFEKGVNTEFKLSSDGKIGFGDKLAFETYSFINEIGNDLKVTVKKWNDYFTDENDDRLVYAGRYDEALKKYNTSGNEALTNAFNIFGKDTIVDYIVNNADPKLLYYSDKGEYNVLVAEKGEDILIKSSDTEAIKDTKLTFNNISSTGKITIGVTEGNNEVTFGSGKDSSVSIKGENGIDFSTSTTAVTINIAGEKENDITKITANDRDNIINLSGNKISIGEIALGTGDNTVKISDISNITKLGSITAETQDKNSLEIVNGIEKSESGKLISLLKSDIKGISKVELGDGNDISVNEKYSYSGKINLSSNNKVDVLNGGVLKSLNFTGDNNIVTLNGGSAEGDLTFAGNNNQTVLNSGTLTGTLDFGSGTENIFTVNTGNEFNYKVKNADTISLNSSKEWTFGNGAEISGDTKINLNGNTALLSTTSDGTKVTLNRNFAEGNVTFSNGTIKITLNQNTDFSNGVNTKLTLNDGGLTGDAKLQTYAFLNVNADKTINVIDWKTLSGDKEEDIKDNHIITYNSTIKKFNNDGIYGVLTVWEKDSIVSWIKQNGEVLEDHTIESNKGDYSGIVSSGTITIDTDKGGKLEDLDIKDLSSKDVVIGNNTAEGDGKVEFTGNTAVSGTVTNNSKEDVDIIFGGKTEIGAIENNSKGDTEISFGGNTNAGTIDSSKSEGKTDINININNDKDKFVSGNIIFNDKDGNTLDIENGSNIDKIGTITGNVDITIDNIGENSDGFNNILAGADAGLDKEKDNNSITVNNSADVNITNKYDGTLTFNGEENNITVGNSIGTLITGAGKDTVTLESNVGSLNTGSNDDIINLNVNKFADKEIKVNLDGGDGNDIFNIISLKSEKSVNENPDKQPEKSLTGKINSLETINLKTDIGFASDLKITGTNEIKLNGNDLFISVDKNKVSGEKDNKPILTGHALYDKGIKVDNSTGKIVIDVTQGALNSFISMGDTNKTTFTDENNFISNSVNFEVEYDKDGGLLSLHTKEYFLGKDERIKYGHLEKIYQSIASAGDKILLMNPSANTDNKSGETFEERRDEAVKAQLEFYGKIYHSTPYAYSNDVSKKSADLITESIMNLKVMPEYKHWVFGGSIAGQEIDSDSNFYGSNYYNGIDIGKNEVSADTNIYGAYAFGKYGIGVNQSVGFALAGTRSDTDISGNSKLEGDAVYISAFAEQEMNNLKLLAGISYQHSFYDSTRNVSNAYQSMSVDEKYEDDLISVFAGGKYSYHLGNNFFAEPNIKLTLTHVMQNGIDEGDNGELTIETDKKDFTFAEGEIGIDLVKKVNLSKGALSLKAGTSFVYSFDGYEEEYLTGKITGSSKSFEMISPEDDRTRVKFKAGAEYEMTTGMFMNLHGNYTTSSHAEDYAVSFGAGYKF